MTCGRKHARSSPILLTNWSLQSYPCDCFTMEHSHNARSQASLRLFHMHGDGPGHATWILVTVHDHKDRVLLFISEIVQSKVYETSPIRTEVMKLVAVG
uniref:Uncharacterized protein n=1 Tax=Trichogramma kaykai TaxID=54128 RepID=A0ABD2WST9_9HYME